MRRASCPPFTPLAPTRAGPFRGRSRSPKRMRTQRLGRKAFAMVAVCLASARCEAVVSAPTMSLFRVDAVRSKVGFELDAPGHIVHGTAGKMIGEVTFDPEDLSRQAHTTFEVEAGAPPTANKVRDKKKRGGPPGGAKYPENTFRSPPIHASAPTPPPG